ncbi:Phosphoribosylformylglycinamidine synthase, glutamine amidotransferase subunit [hydrothermal vent metagenome]|uniref:Phosphoribosylformylglycinamidine synthase, glutamine amidotransferase subunit n=1 Tax=hydrothermal vent metagenome TaxID=652676 RepID=A0A3B0T7W4_9ZZZZ
MKAAVIVFPGSNCDRDAAGALARATGRQPAMVWHTETALPDTEIIVVPGGFTHGDYLRVGAMAATAPIMGAIRAAAGRGVAVLGICNGFQILCEAGLLPGALMRNASLKFICRDVWLRVENSTTPFTRDIATGAVLRLPVAHHDGNYFADEATLARLEDEGRVVFRYVDKTGARSAAANPNGSRNDIAGICNAMGNVVGLMPHPERAIDPATGGTDGAALFSGMMEAVT